MKKVIRRLGTTIKQDPAALSSGRMDTTTPGDPPFGPDDPDELISLLARAEDTSLAVVLEASCFSRESYELWKLYQSEIHKDAPDKRMYALVSLL